MTKPRALALGIVVALLMGVQHWGLEREPETVLEAPMKKVANLPASQVLPTYVATLFFGAFRAVAVDILWIQLRKAKEEKRWYEMREVTQFISYVQPRNPEVWSHLGWDSAYNIANGFTDKEEWWKWVKFGLLWLRKGITTLPKEPYLKHQLGYTLWHKVGWKEGELDVELLRRIEADAELQAALLPDGVKSDRPLSAFEIAYLWFGIARDELLEDRYKITQMGLYLYPDTMDGFARLCLMLQGMHEWRQNKPEQAKYWFRRAHDHVAGMLKRAPDAPAEPGFEKKYPNHISPIFRDYEKMYAMYPEMVDLNEKAKTGDPAAERALLAFVQRMIVDHGPIDDGWIWDRRSPECLLNKVKLKLTKGEDVQECNDSFDLATDIKPGDKLFANLAPEGLDVDYYFMLVVPPGPEPHPASPPRPVAMTVTIERPPAAKGDLKASFFDHMHRPIKEEILKGFGPDGKRKLQLSLAQYGRYFVKVELADPALPWPADTRYRLQYDVEH